MDLPKLTATELGKTVAKKINSTVISERLGKCYGESAERLRIETHDLLPSTNDEAKCRAADGAREGLVIIADGQTDGRGRRGREFFSPPGTGLYMSLLLRPDSAAELSTRITTMAAVAVSEAIQRVSGRYTQIKWVNDVLLDGKKVCGILTESATRPNGMSDYVVLGIGVNVLSPEGDFPDDISDKAAAIFSRNTAPDFARELIAAEILGSFMRMYGAVPPTDYIGKYRSRLCYIGERISVITPDGAREAMLNDVDNQCRLSVTYDDGSTDFLYSGEISIRQR